MRHCETKKLASEEPADPRNNSSLLATGLQQTERLAAYLRPMPTDQILTSLLQRSQQTASILNRERHLPVFSSMALNEYFPRDDYEGVETTEQGLVQSVGYLNQFRPYFEHIAVVGHNAISSSILKSLLNMLFETGKAAFSRVGICWILRYDWRASDQNWREAGSFIP
ncbi:MAG TPA: phosphoglycerate mutase family protein [Blastocatellia bacterium]|nr:phosphoglycerate mutase family protein [Blastocatellia bacterium]